MRIQHFIEPSEGRYHAQLDIVDLSAVEQEQIAKLQWKWEQIPNLI